MAKGSKGNGRQRKCVECGSPIPPGRLEALPNAVLCVKCTTAEKAALAPDDWQDSEELRDIAEGNGNI